VVATVLTPTLGSAQIETISFLNGEYKVAFDPSIVPKEVVIGWVQLSPEMSSMNGLGVSDSLETCIASRKEYKPCGSRDPWSVNFFYNAGINLQKIRNRIRHLRSSFYPEELRPIAHYLERVQQFWLWKETQRLAFYRTWNITELERPYDQINPKSECSTLLDEIAQARDRRQKYQLSQHDWWNCVWDAERVRIGDYPQADWDRFLLHYQIQEKVYVDDD
jgi:hypothetical protein